MVSVSSVLDQRRGLVFLSSDFKAPWFKSPYARAPESLNKKSMSVSCHYGSGFCGCHKVQVEWFAQHGKGNSE